MPDRPELVSASIVPSELAPGDSAVVRAEFRDHFGIIARVEGFIAEDPDIEFKLRDDGVGVDEVALDGVWTLQVDVPFNAPLGDFVLEVVAYASDERPILVRNELGEVATLSAICKLRIRDEG